MSAAPSRSCPQCGAPIPAGAAEGLCPRCLFALNLATQTRLAGETQPPAAGGPSAVPPLSLEEVAKLFPQLEIIRLVGIGGMGAVYQARQPALDRHVALKLLHTPPANDPGFAERFAQEARALAKLTHPNIVALHEFGQAGGRPYFLMEFVDGVNLRQLQQAERLSPREALQIVPQVCDALQYAHDEGIVHRDIKPENVLIDRKGRVKVADFGLAKLMGLETAATRLTGAGHVMGTPHYMAPEQVEHPLDVDHRADIFSLGVVFYELLTGELPLGRFAAPSKKVQIDVRLDEVVLRALEKEPSLRYGQASELKTQVETIARAPAAVETEAGRADANKPAANSRRARVALGCLLVGLVGTPVFFALANHSGERPGVMFALLTGLLALVFGGLARKERLGRVVLWITASVLVITMALSGVLALVRNAQFRAVADERQRQMDLWPLDPKLVVESSHRTNERPRFHVEWPASSWRVKNFAAVETKDRFFLRINGVDYPLRTPHEPYAVREFDLDPLEEGVPVMWLPGKYRAAYVVKNSDYVSRLSPQTMASRGENGSNEVEFEIPPLPAKVPVDAKAPLALGPVIEAWAADVPADFKFTSENLNLAVLTLTPEVKLYPMPRSLGPDGVPWVIKVVNSVEDRNDPSIVAPGPEMSVEVNAKWEEGRVHYSVTATMPEDPKTSQASDKSPDVVAEDRVDLGGISIIELGRTSPGIRRVILLRFTNMTTLDRIEMEGLTALQAWLPLMDAGRYAESWDRAAESFRQAVSRAEWVKKSEKIRRPLGGLISRTCAFTQQTKTFPGMPDGSYWIAELNSSFPGLKSAAETVMFTREKDGGWRVISYLIRPRTEEQQAAVAAARIWLMTIDDGHYASSWTNAAKVFRDALTREKWVTSLEGVRRPLGERVFRVAEVCQTIESLPGAPAGKYVVMRFSASFADCKSAVETVTFVQENDGMWRAAGYFIK